MVFPVVAWYSLSSAGVEQQGDEGGCSGAGAVVGQQRVLELILADDKLRKLHVQLVLGPEYLNVLRDVGGKVFHGPRSVRVSTTM